MGAPMRQALPPGILAEAVETLQQGGERVVLGPSADGGYIPFAATSVTPDVQGNCC
jgi:glycosyltransferase A (GT-A) superfamily protein (DUF2064 family)